MLFNYFYIILKDRVKKTLSITSRTVELEEKGVRLKLTVVDTPGFGESINNQDRYYFIYSKTFLNNKK